MSMQRPVSLRGLVHFAARQPRNVFSGQQKIENRVPANERSSDLKC